ncbi:MAG: RNA polymerase sigma-70 factor [Pedobacter sp.]|jgi:RNA polymerase sigma-70 factor (ECF subfamily)
MNDFSSYNDQQLMIQIQSGNDLAFAELYERYWELIFRHVLKMLGNKDDTKDLVQEIFTNLWVKSADIDPDTNLTGYLYVSARNKVINMMRHNKVKKDYLSSLSRFVLESDPSIFKQLDEKDLFTAVEKEIQNLPDKMRGVFELSRKKYLSHKEIALELHISDKTVKKQINNAIKILRLRLTSLLLIVYLILL